MARCDCTSTRLGHLSAHSQSHHGHRPGVDNGVSQKVALDNVSTMNLMNTIFAVAISLGCLRRLLVNHLPVCISSIIPVHINKCPSSTFMPGWHGSCRGTAAAKLSQAAWSSHLLYYIALWGGNRRREAVTNNKTMRIHCEQIRCQWLPLPPAQQFAPR